MLEDLWVHCTIIKKRGHLIGVEEINKLVDRLFILRRNNQKTCKEIYKEVRIELKKKKKTMISTTALLILKGGEKQHKTVTVVEI